LKRISTFVILTIVCVFLFNPATVNAQDKTEAPLIKTEAIPDSVKTVQDEATHKLMVYYFHGKKRCMSCRTIEGYTHDTILTYFPDQLESGRIEWQIVNYANPKHAHFKEDFGLYTQSVVLVEMKKDEIIRWKNLKDVWTLIRKKEAFYEYIREEVAGFLSKEK